MSSFDSGEFPTEIDSLMASVKFDINNIDVVADFAQDFLNGGLHGLALQSPEGVALFKDMYDQMWDRIANVLLSKDAPWRHQELPENKIVHLFESIWDLHESPEHGQIAIAVFCISFNDDKSEGVCREIFGTTSYFGKNELQRTIASICNDGNFCKFGSADHTAQFLMKFISVTYSHILLSTDESLYDKDTWLNAIRDSLKNS